MSQPQTAEAKRPAPPATFTVGSTMRHVLVMTGTGSIGLMAIFFVDFLSLMYVSWLGDKSLTAAVGFATVVLFLTTSVNIGLMIAIGALVSRRLGAGDRDGARRIGASSLTLMALTAGLVALVALPLSGPLLDLLGARGETHAVAARFLAITLPSNVLMALGMGFSGVLRAVGDARRAMYVTLAGGVVTAFADPLLIFWAGLGVDGAAIATVISRLIFALVGFQGAVLVHGLVARPSPAHIGADARAVFDIAGPAILTNVATPISLAFVNAVMARFGDWAVAANAIIDRLVPVAFGALFALSGAVGPILGQNWGARRFDRMRQALKDGFVFCAVYVGVVWLALILGRHEIARLFGVTGEAAAGVAFFCWVAGPTWLFVGLLFTANAAFNNLGFPLYSTAFNWGRATLGTAPFAWAGAQAAGFEGALVGVMAGAAIFGVWAAVVAFQAVARLEKAARG